MTHGDDDAVIYPRRGEDLGLFQLRLRLLRRLGGVLDRLSRAGFGISVEGDDARAEGSDADYIIQYGDLRVRLTVLPDVDAPQPSSALLQEARLQLLQHPDADAVIFVGAGESLPACVFDLYDTYSRVGASVAATQGDSLERVLRDFFTANVVAVELPDFKNLIELPDRSELRRLLEESVRTEFHRLRQQRAVIPEKRAALESIAEADLGRIIVAITETLDSKSPRALIPRVVGEDA